MSTAEKKPVRVSIDVAATRMRILIVTPWFPSGEGDYAGIFVAEQAFALSRHADVAILHLAIGAVDVAPTIDSWNGLQVIRTTVRIGSDRRGKLRDVEVLLQLMRGISRRARAAANLLVKEWGTADIVHAHVMFPSAVAAQAIAGRLGVPYVVTEHSASYMLGSTDWSWTGSRVDRMVRAATDGAEVLVAVSTAQSRALSEFDLGRAHRVIPNIVPVPAGAMPYPATSPKRIAHLSLMRENHKNIGMLLDACARLWGDRQDFELVLGGDGPDRELLEDRARECGLLGTAVRFSGPIDRAEVPTFFARSHFSVVSSRVETFCVAAAESLASGRPVVSTRCGGPEDFVDKATGRLVPSDDAGAMAEALDWMLDNYATFSAEELAEHARATFSAERVAGELLALYAEARRERGA